MAVRAAANQACRSWVRFGRSCAESGLPSATLRSHVLCLVLLLCILLEARLRLMPPMLLRARLDGNRAILLVPSEQQALEAPSNSLPATLPTNGAINCSARHQVAPSSCDVGRLVTKPLPAQEHSPLTTPASTPPRTPPTCSHLYCSSPT